MKIHSKLAGTKGFISLWERMILFRDMITSRAEKRVEILSFFEKHGLEATKDAYKVSKATIYRWQKTFEENERKIQTLVPKSTAPKRRRIRHIPDEVKTLILQERKIAKRKKLRSKDHAGGLVKADTIVRFTNGLKRYILTAIDLESEFAYAYKSHASKEAADFMRTFKSIAPIQLTHIQTDNGSEFQDHFEIYLNYQNITHFHTYPRCPKMNAEIERFNRTLSEAFIQQHRHLLAHNLPLFNRKMMDWLIWYNTRRPHWSIGLISPLRYIVNKLPTRESQMCWTSTGP